MKIFKNCIILLLFVMGFFSCKTQIEKKIQLTGTAQGTYYSITYFDQQSRDFKAEIDSILSAYDQSVSVYEKNSIISRINRNDEAVVLDDWFIGNFKLSQTISEETNGSFDITIAPIANIWGFGTFEKPDSINPELIDSLKQYVDYRKIKLIEGKLVKENPAIQLNFNAVAQGYAVDVLGHYFESKGIYNYLIDIGGEIYAKGKKTNGDPWKIGIELPEEGSENRSYSKIVDLENEAVATSGNYRKFYVLNGKKYAHSLNPKTGYPVLHSLLSVTVIASTAGAADAYATAFMVMGVKKTLAFVETRKDIKVYLMYHEKGEIKSAMSASFIPYLEPDSK